MLFDLLKGVYSSRSFCVMYDVLSKNIDVTRLPGQLNAISSSFLLKLLCLEGYKGISCLW
jgi:hypothetical protein